MYRHTYVEVNLKNLKDNVKMLIERYKDYKYYFGVIKADCYGHNDLLTVKTIIDAGCNFLAVATLDEALLVRMEFPNIPILCLGIIDIEDIFLCAKNNISVTISTLEYLKMLKPIKDLKVHIKINTGMNRLGVNNKKEFMEIYRLVNKNFTLEGIYTHIYEAPNKENTNKQYLKFEQITKDIDLKSVPIVHVGASEATEFYPKKEYANGTRLGISMYGLIDFKGVNFKSTFTLHSKVMQINTLTYGETLGYNATYTATGNEKIAVIPIGYADGIIRKNKGRYVYINDKRYQIVGNICMDMLFVKIDDSISIGDEVLIIKDIEHIKEIAKHLDTITYEVICTIGKRVPRKYIT